MPELVLFHERFGDLTGSLAVSGEERLYAPLPRRRMPGGVEASARGEDTDAEEFSQNPQAANSRHGTAHGG